MPREQTVQIAALNIAAHPHPADVYVGLLRAASDFLVKARGTDYAKITKPRKSRGLEVYTGRILVWTEIDVNGPWLNLKEEEELSPSLRNAINIPPEAKPNYRVFSYAFEAEHHRLYFETRNEFGEHLGETTALRVFRLLLSKDVQGLDIPDVEVTVIPERGAVSRILALPGLRSLELTVVLPNPDADADAEARVFGQLNAARARRKSVVYTKQAGADHLIATPEIIETASVAANNGMVRGVGREDGKRNELSTTHLPKRKTVSMEAGHDFLSRLLSIGFF